jgi:DnaK suppressor protein
MMSLSEASRQRFREMLLEMRQDLLDRAKVQGQSAGNSESTGDLADCASSGMAAEYVFMLRSRLKERLLLIDDALDAIESGDYGICEQCEEPINEKRLDLMPFTRLCVRCRSGVEKEARMRGRIAV